MYELNSLLWSIFCAEEVWSDLSVQKTQKIQHANSAAVKKSDQSFHHVNLNVEDLTELKTVIK